MKAIFFLLFIPIILSTSCCTNENCRTIEADQWMSKFLDDINLWVPKGKLIHRGVFNPSMSEFHVTLSNEDYSDFTIYSCSYNNQEWTIPVKAGYNSSYDDHGMSFSPDGSTVYFSSTRPIDGREINGIWQLWSSTFIDSVWTEPQYLNIPSLKDQHVSHPSVTKDGILFFHSSLKDYSQMRIYQCPFINDSLGEINVVLDGLDQVKEKGTPYVSSAGNRLAYVTIEKNLNLHLATKTAAGDWAIFKSIDSLVNIGGKGNPFLMENDTSMIYTRQKRNSTSWELVYLKLIL